MNVDGVASNELEQEFLGSLQALFVRYGVSVRPFPGNSSTVSRGEIFWFENGDYTICIPVYLLYMIEQNK